MIYSIHDYFYDTTNKECVELSTIFSCISIDRDDLEGKSMYAFAYKEDDRALNYLCPPVYGMIKGRKFYEYKKDGINLKKNGVSVDARYFADAYEEAVYGFNQLLRRRIAYLKQEIEKCQAMKIKLWSDKLKLVGDNNV